LVPGCEGVVVGVVVGVEGDGIELGDLELDGEAALETRSWSELSLR
jgi:hypothetical protein